MLVYASFLSESCSDNCNVFLSFVPGKALALLLLCPLISLRHSERTSVVAAPQSQSYIQLSLTSGFQPFPFFCLYYSSSIS